MDKQQFAVQLFNAGAIKFGEFKLKTGVMSPVYVDLRVLISYPELVENVSNHLGRMLEFDDLAVSELICGVPYTAIPFASCVSVKKRFPMLMRRKEAKEHGTRQMIEGYFQPGQPTLIIEDILSSGTSILETVVTLREAGLPTKNALIILDRQQGGKANLNSLGINVHSIITIHEVLDTLAFKKMISADQRQRSIDWLAANPVTIRKQLIEQYNSLPTPAFLPLTRASNVPDAVKHYTLTELAESAFHPVQKRLFRLMVEKKSNLCVSLDETKAERVLNLMQQLGDQVILVKLHADIIEDFSDEFVQKSLQLAEEKRFLLFEDRKFADIGNTVRLQFAHGLHRIREWADVINCHALPGPGVLEGLRKGLGDRLCGCLLVAQLSCDGNLIDDSYTKTTVQMAETNRDLVIGYISQSRVSSDPHLLHMTPGVHLDESGDSLGQKYISPAQAVLERGADIVIVGRGVTGATNPIETAIRYKENAFNALQQRLSNQSLKA